MFIRVIVLSIVGLLISQSESYVSLSGQIVVSIDGDLHTLMLDGQGSQLLVDNGCENTPRQVVAYGAQLIFHSRELGEACPVIGTNALDLLTREMRHLSPAAGVVSPDGTQMAEIRRTIIYNRYTNSGPYEIVLWDLQAGTEQVIGSGRHFFVPGIDVSWSLDGERIAYETQANATFKDEIAIFDLRTGETQHLTDEDTYITTPSWSPDGERLAFYAGWEIENTGIYVVDDSFDWSNAEFVGSTERSAEAIHWSPNGASTVYVARTSYREELWLTMLGVSTMNMETGEANRIHPQDENGFMPGWSPDSTRFTYVSNVPEIVPLDPQAETITYRIASLDYHLHIVEGDRNRIIYTCDTCILESPVWLP